MLVVVQVHSRSMIAPYRTRSLDGFFILLVFALAMLIGLSRVAVGAHWPVDVFAGAACGWLAGCSGAWISARFPEIWRSSVSQFVIGQLFLLTGLWLLFKTPAYPAGVLAVWLAVACVLATVTGSFYKMRKHLRQMAESSTKPGL